MLQLNQNLLRAAATLAAKKDIRHYLEAIRIEPADERQVLYIATDGHVLGVFADEYPASAAGDFTEPVTLPLAAVNNALKLAGKNGVIELDGLHLVTPGGEVRADALRDTRYPDWRMVWPATVHSNNALDANAYDYDPELLLRATTALGLANGLPPARAKKFPAVLMHNEHEGGAGIMRSVKVDGGVVVMPRRIAELSSWTPPGGNNDA